VRVWVSLLKLLNPWKWEKLGMQTLQSQMLLWRFSRETNKPLIVQRERTLIPKKAWREVQLYKPADHPSLRVWRRSGSKKYKSLFIIYRTPLYMYVSFPAFMIMCSPHQKGKYLDVYNISRTSSYPHWCVSLQQLGAKHTHTHTHTIEQ